MTMDVLLLGCGRIAHAHAVAIEDCADVRLRAVCDIDSAAAQWFVAQGRVAAYENADAALRATTPAIAVICTPPATHAALVTACLHAGAHVLCEKPLGIAASEVEAMNATAHAANRALMMAAKFRFMPAARALQGRIAAGELGEILFCRITFFSSVDMRGRMNADRALSGGGVVMDNGPHAFDLARFLLGPLTNIAGEMWPSSQNLPVEDGATLRFMAQKWTHLRGEIALSWSAHAATPHFVEVCGTRGAASLSWDEYDKRAAFHAQMAHFASVARGERDGEVTPADALACARAIDAVYSHWNAKSG